VDFLRLDFETFSELDLKTFGLYNYATHKSTGVSMLGFKFPGEEIQQWFPHEGAMPERLKLALLNPEISLSAFNSQFERYILQYQLDIVIPAERFYDPQISCRYLSMPGSLDVVGEILGLPPEFAKDKRGDFLINFFAKPQKKSLGRGKGSTLYFNNHLTHPKEWEEYCHYNRQDIRAEEEVMRRCTILGAFPLPPFERKLWIFDQTVNDKGMPTDVVFVQKAYKLGLRAKQEALNRQNKITGLENANSRTQLLPWLQERGYPFNTLRKDTVTAVLNDSEVKLTTEALEVLKTRKEASSISYKKLKAILKTVSSDGRLRNQFIFLGSSRCGRWSGSTAQLHNMSRPDGTFEDTDNINAARAMVYAEDYEGIKARFGSVLLVIKNLIRTVFTADPVPAPLK